MVILILVSQHQALPHCYLEAHRLLHKKPSHGLTWHLTSLTTDDWVYIGRDDDGDGPGSDTGEASDDNDSEDSAEPNNAADDDADFPTPMVQDSALLCFLQTCLQRIACTNLLRTIICNYCNVTRFNWSCNLLGWRHIHCRFWIGRGSAIDLFYSERISNLMNDLY